MAPESGTEYHTPILDPPKRSFFCGAFFCRCQASKKPASVSSVSAPTFQKTKRGAPTITWATLPTTGFFCQEFIRYDSSIVALSAWKPTKGDVPSPTRKGESDFVSIYTGVGKALHQWEHMESGLTRLFQVLCETPNFAACRAYGTIESSFSKSEMLRAAAEAFFAKRNPDSENQSAIKELLSACKEAQQYRNNIAHGMAVGFHLEDGAHSGYFLCPPSYASKKVGTIDPYEVYLLGAKYWYNTVDLNHYANRFQELLSETMTIIQRVNKKYNILRDDQLHP